MTTNDGDTTDRPLPRCGYHQTPRDDCAICDVIRRGLVPVPIVVMCIRRPPLTLRRLIADLWPVFGGGIVLCVGTGIMAELCGASWLVQLGLDIVGAVVGMVLVALLLDHRSGRRRLWGRRKLPPVPPRATMPEQIPEPRSTT